MQGNKKAGLLSGMCLSIAVAVGGVMALGGLSVRADSTAPASSPLLTKPDENPELLDADAVALVRETLLRNLPEEKRTSFRDSSYGWLSQAYELVSGEALAAGSAMASMSIATGVSAYVKPAVRWGTGEFLGQYGSLFTDFFVDYLTSQNWEELGFRSGVNVFSWFVGDYLSTEQMIALRYLLVHGALIAETLPDIWNSLLPTLRGSRELLCMDPRVCEVVHISYHVPDMDFSPDTGQPWLALEFPWGGIISEPENSYEEALWRLRDWVQERGIEAVHLYPEIDNGQLRIWARAWQSGMAGKLYRVPGHFGMGRTCRLVDKCAP